MASASHVLTSPNTYHTKPKVYHTATMTRKPKHWKMRTNSRDECLSTRDTYRLSRTTNRCPREARIRERSCCTSREAGGDSDEVSLEFLRQLNAIYSFATVESNPRALERVLRWIKSLPEDSEVVLDPNDQLRADMSTNDRFVDLVKFCLMSRSDVTLTGYSHRIAFGLGLGCVYNLNSLWVDRRCEHFDDIVRVTNEVGIDDFAISGAGGQMMVVPAVRAVKLKVNGVTNFEDITNHLRTAITNEWNLIWVNFDLEGFTVIKSTTTVSEAFRSMFNALKGTTIDILARFSMYNGVDEIPQGYTALVFPRKVEHDQDGELQDIVDISSIVSVIASSASDYEFDHQDDNSFGISYTHEERVISFYISVHEQFFQFSFTT